MITNNGMLCIKKMEICHLERVYEKKNEESDCVHKVKANEVGLLDEYWKR